MALQNGINWLQSLAGFPAPPQPESQAESQPPAPAPPTARALSSPWLATHVENVVRETQQSAFRGTYELVRVVSARDATPAGRGGEVRVSDGRHSCRVFVPRAACVAAGLAMAARRLPRSSGCSSTRRASSGFDTPARG